MKYAIFGGSFDPPHLGHLEMAQAVRDVLQLDEVVFVPNNRNPLKPKASADAKARLEMVSLLIDGEEGLSVSDIETSRPGRSYSVDTVEEFQMVRPGEIWFVIGTDALESILSWKKPERLVRLCRLAVVTRPGKEYEKIKSNLPDWVKEQIDMVPMAPNKTSSSFVREEIARKGTPDLWLDPKVWEYISERGLYRKEKPEID